LAADFCTGGVLAVHGYEYGSGHSRLVKLDSNVMEQLQNGQFVSLEPSEAEQFRLFDAARYADSQNPAAASAQRRCRQAVTRIARQLRGDRSTSAEVCVALWRGHAREQHWLEVVGAESKYSSWQLHGTLTGDSALWPHLRAGMRVAIGPYDVLEVRGQ
jgi:hypothetical protein